MSLAQRPTNALHKCSALTFQCLVRTGRILYGYGNVKASQAEAARTNGDIATYYKYMSESKQLHNAALAQLDSTVGEHHHRVADACHKLAGHSMLCERHDEAQYVLSALSVRASD